MAAPAPTALTERPDRVPPLGTGFGRALLRGLPLLRAVGLSALGIAILLGIWSLLAAQLGPLRLPGPIAVYESILANWQAIPAMQYLIMQRAGIADGVTYTVVQVVATVAIGGAAGLMVGIAMPYVRPLRIVVSPILVVLGTIPVLILLPFLIQWFGNGRFVLSGLVILFAFVTMAVVAIESAANAAGRYRNAARSLGAGPLFEMRHVILPALVPDIFAGLRVSLAAAWSLQAIAEVVGGQGGSGRIIGTMASMSNTTLVIAVVVCLAVIAVVIDAILVIVGKGIVRWKP